MRRYPSRVGVPWLGALLLSLFLSSCAAPLKLGGADRPRVPGRPAVVIVSIDGLRPDAIPAAGAHTLLRLMEEGSHASDALTIPLSHTLPSHTSMLTGVALESHGIHWNNDRVSKRGPVEVPTIFALARGAGFRTGAVMGKSKLRHLVQPGSLDWVSVPRGDWIDFAPTLVPSALEVIRFGAPDLLFVHISEPDVVGHGVGWMTRPYLWAVRRADAAVARILEAARSSYGDDLVLIVTSDHGGEGRGHGADVPHDREIPWIVWGAGVRPGALDRTVHTYDTAATALWILGMPVPEQWAGAPVREAFHVGADGAFHHEGARTRSGSEAGGMQLPR